MKRDWKFMIGMAVLVAVMALICVFFWKTVAQQAALVKEEEAREEASAVRAICMYYGDVLKTDVFVDMDSKEIFCAEIPSEGIVNKAGTMIHGDVLEEGDMVRIYGSLSSEQKDSHGFPVYTGITKMQRIGRATLEEAEEYRVLLRSYSLTSRSAMPDEL